jgi:hypothetical protein
MGINKGIKRGLRAMSGIAKGIIRIITINNNKRSILIPDIL